MVATEGGGEAGHTLTFHEMQKRPHHSVAERIAGLGSKERSELLKSLSQEEAQAILHNWRFWARPKQLPPGGDWFCWLVIAGRGFGKTRMGAEWVRSLVEGPSPLTSRSDVGRIALVADTYADARDIMVDGESGILACSKPQSRPVFESSKRRLVWPNGAIATLYSADEPDQLRGPQHHIAWGDELAKWRRGDETWSNLLLGLRLGARPRAMVTTTPRPIPLLKALINAPSTVITKGGTLENSAHLPGQFLTNILGRYAGSRLGRQEINGELLEDVDGALWNYDLIEMLRVRDCPSLGRIVVAIDPPVTGHHASAACGIVVAGVGVNGELYVLEDASIQGVSPENWARQAIKVFHHYKADRIVAEVNNGGDLVESVMRTIDPKIAFKAVRASRGKLVRAEPVATLYEQGRVHHVGMFSDLEDEMCNFRGQRDKSPDRMDALVWALTELGLGTQVNAPRIRQVQI